MLQDLVLKLKNQIINQINEFEYNKDIINRMRNAINTEKRLIDCSSIIKIKNNKIIIEKMANSEKNRTLDIINLIENSINYIIKKNMSYPNTTLFFFISDVYNYEHQDFPFIIMAKPKNKKGILIPDNTFTCHNNPNSKCENFTQVMNICKSKNIKSNIKKDKIFFIGANTDKNRQNIRDNLFKLSNNITVNNIKLEKQKLPLEIYLNKRIHICDFTNYKYLLNLPGNQPWSYRFKYLFLMNSLVINVDVRQKYNSSEYFNETWINFIDTIFEPNIDYINLTYYWKENDTSYNNYEFKKLISNLKKTYEFFNNNNEQYEKFISSGYNKSQQISSDLISESIFLIVYYYSKKINDFLE